MAARALVIAAPGSGAGKTTVTLGLLRALRNSGVAVAAAKSGPDYIDPGFHAAAIGATSVNLDAWAMGAAELRARAAAQAGDLLLVEGAVGVLDGAGRAGRGSAADLAAALGAPIVLVLDAARAGASAVLPAVGLSALMPAGRLAGVILNRVASPRHLAQVLAGAERAGVRVLGHVRRDPALALPERHLGLVQAAEHPALDALIDRAAAAVADGVDLGALAAAARPLAAGGAMRRLAPPGQRLAVASDRAFGFAYPHLLSDWRDQGAAVVPFSPLADEAPSSDADWIFLPGGYPELHAPAIAAATRFRRGMEAAVARGTPIYGECGGYMVLGRGLTDADGRGHPMLGLLPVETSFADRRLSLGYRRLAARAGSPWTGALAGHEFHYATVTASGAAPPLFDAADADSEALTPMGHVVGRVAGSFAHVIGPGPAEG